MTVSFADFHSVDAAQPRLEPASSDEGAIVPGRRISIYRMVTLFVVADVVGLAALGIIPLVVRRGMHRGTLEFGVEFHEIIALGISLVAFILIQQLLGSYRTKKCLSMGWSVGRLALSLLATFSLLMMIAAAAKVTGTYSRIWFFSWMAGSLLLLPLLRAAVIAKTRRALATGAYVHRAFSLGLLAVPLKQSEIRKLTGGLARADTPFRVDSVDQLQWLTAYIRDNVIDEVYVTVPWLLAPEFCRKNQALRNLSTNVYIVPVDEDVSNGLVGARYKGDRLQIHVVDRPLDGWGRVAKRLMDIGLASVAIVALSWLMLLVAIAIKLESRGDVFFRQKRKGFNGRVFEVFKFRSMRSEAEDAGASVQTSRGDRRVTRVGRFIRRTSIDELPQLLNVLRGEMSLVGPRPHALETRAEGQALEEAASNYAFRHRVLPGITGLAQVSGVRGEIDSIEKLEQRVQYDIEYIDTWSLMLDLEILCRTVLRVFYDPRAY